MNDLSSPDPENPWQLALEGSGAGLWDWNLVTGAQTHSARWDELIGYTPGELAQSYEEFRAAAVKAKISPYALKHDSRVRHVPAGCSDLLCPINQRPPLGIEAAKAKP